MDLDIVKWIQSFRNPVFDWLFYIITQIGDQYVFIAAAVIIYWTIDKKFAHKFVFTFMVSAIVNSGIKELFKRVRPFYLPGVETEPHWNTDGYAFPSGHAQAAGVLGYTLYDVSKKTQKKWVWYIGIAILILVPLSRVYLGQHYLSDVIVGVVLSFVIAHFVFKLVDKMGDDEHIYTLMLAPIFIALLFFVKNHDLYIAAGGFVGFACGYYLEKKYVSYEVKNILWIQVLKVVIGLIIALAIKEGFKMIFPDVLFFDFVRYLLIGVWAALGAPYVFKHAFKNRKKII
ncbi:phosphatase PAP2 family protein [Peloplasma aerotolerans]|jgi:membrane-associated phospholipid phosphatase|uniref:Phosphatase PAP2 family protein n=1 Tax=Peloplasma aerotolerans TaxID=3044389 RepID=A0AAW6U315_9MOLU|nr:phosphatase PAP2 family protein [Mariniplasma sp. M4Ah]MDI6452297.1 phosphatase PAP2 family protein [Mariniplasma sp. M4Ah]MDR4969098.1 phosphatase PAP2 family protein [Acholeplasmataceae bacterium]